MHCSAATCAPHETLTPKSGCFEVEQEEDLASACFEHEAEDKLASGRKPAWGGRRPIAYSSELPATSHTTKQKRGREIHMGLRT